MIGHIQTGKVNSSGTSVGVTGKLGSSEGETITRTPLQVLLGVFGITVVSGQLDFASNCSKLQTKMFK